MSGAISVDSEWFYTTYSRALEALTSIDNILRESLDVGSHVSFTQKGFLREYIHLRNSVAAVLNLMAGDWNATKVCVENITHFDGYVSRLVNRESVNRMDIGCDELWRNSNQTNINLDIAEEVSLGSMSGFDYVCLETIKNLELLISKLNELASPIGAYVRVINEVTGKEDFSGSTFDAIKNYMSRVHISVCRSMIAAVDAFAEKLSDYQSSYLNNHFDDNYDYNVIQIERFRDAILESYRNLRDKINEFNHYVWSRDTSRYEIRLEDISHYSIDNAEALVNAQVSELNNILSIIDSNESRGLEDVENIRAFIDSLDNVLFDLGPSFGYRMINPDRQFESVSSLSGMRSRLGSSSIGLYCDILLDPSSSEHEETIRLLKDSITAKLIGTFKREGDDYYNYNAYSSYDEEILSGMINNLPLNDTAFVSRWRDLYNSMLDNGYTNLNATRYAAIAALFNRDSIMNCSDITAEQDSIVINGIRNYVVNYTTHIANSELHGYDQGNRWGRNGDFDCASLTVMAYEKAFINLRDVTNDINVGSEKLSTVPMEDYGFISYVPNKDVYLDGLVPGDIFAIDTTDAEPVDGRGKHHVEVFAGRFEDKDGNVDYLNVSAHSSERIFGVGGKGNNFADDIKDQLQGSEGRDYMSNVPAEPSEDSENYWGTFYKDFFADKEEGYSYLGTERECTGTDFWENDRIGEIRFESIAPRPNWGMESNQIVGYTYWPYTTDEVPTQIAWDRILRLESMEYWKTHR